MNFIKIYTVLLLAIGPLLAMANGGVTGRLHIKNPGSPSVSFPLQVDNSGKISNAEGNDVTVEGSVSDLGAGMRKVNVIMKSQHPAYISLDMAYVADEMSHSECEFYLPGFWYHLNNRSPQNAPSARLSDSWQVREDRLSSPLAGVFNTTDGRYMTVIRMHNGDRADCTVQNQSGEIILPGHTSVGYTGFASAGGKASLTFGYPFVEAPKRYIRKLTMIDPVRAFERIEPGKPVELTWIVREGRAGDYAGFVSDTWNYCYDTLKPVPVDVNMSDDEAKACLSRYFDGSYVDKYDLKYFSGEGLRTEDCASKGGYQVGFVGRVLLNAFNALEYGNSVNRPDLVEKGENIFASVLEHGFTPEGYLIEAVNLENGNKDKFLSIRRQSEGLLAVLTWLDYERNRSRKHPEWEKRVRGMLDNIMTLQCEDGHFPRKFNDVGQHIDGSGGSSSCAVIPFTMAYKYFKDKRYLDVARKIASYMEKEIIDKADYFSSTLDADCEDKEAAIYTSTAYYYLSHVTKGAKRRHYMDLCRESAYFCLSWYYLWDVPFSRGQMLGDVDFRSRGWGNVSVENNHIDVYIFEFASILEKLGEYYNEPRFSDFAAVITGSMLQLMPKEDGTFDIAKAGYYPEVVQHTTWDYGRNGKGFYNDIFAPGWTVASLWQMLSPDRVDEFFD